MTQPRQTLIVMVKQPRPGRVKTRLGKDIGLIPAAWWFRHQVNDLLRRLKDPRWQIVLAVSPDQEGMNSRVWGNFAKIAQGRGDIGERMGRVLGAIRGKTCLIGADIPGVQRQHIASAFHQLGQSDAVFGPATDGGFWLIGTRQPPAGLFGRVRWSTKHTLSDTLAGIPDARVSFVARLRDVDTVDDLAMTSQQHHDSAGP